MLKKFLLREITFLSSYFLRSSLLHPPSPFHPLPKKVAFWGWGEERRGLSAWKEERGKGEGLLHCCLSPPPPPPFIDPSVEWREEGGLQHFLLFPIVTCTRGKKEERKEEKRRIPGSPDMHQKKKEIHKMNGFPLPPSPEVYTSKRSSWKVMFELPSSKKSI